VSNDSIEKWLGSERSESSSSHAFFADKEWLPVLHYARQHLSCKQFQILWAVAFNRLNTLAVALRGKRGQSTCICNSSSRDDDIRHWVVCRRHRLLRATMGAQMAIQMYAACSTRALSKQDFLQQARRDLSRASTKTVRRLFTGRTNVLTKAWAAACEVPAEVAKHIQLSVAADTLLRMQYMDKPWRPIANSPWLR
jgi:hypothetical protein